MTIDNGNKNDCVSHCCVILFRTVMKQCESDLVTFFSLEVFVSWDWGHQVYTAFHPRKMNLVVQYIVTNAILSYYLNSARFHIFSVRVSTATLLKVRFIFSLQQVIPMSKCPTFFCCIGGEGRWRAERQTSYFVSILIHIHHKNMCALYTESGI